METLRFLMISTHFPPHHLGGDAVFVDYLSRELVRRGHEVHVSHNPSVYEVIRDHAPVKGMNDEVTGIRTHPYNPRFRKTDALNALMLGLDGKQRRMVAELARATRPDVVHWHNTRAFIGRPFIVSDEVSLYTSHDYGAVCPRSSLLRPDMQMCEQPRMCALCCLRWKKPPQLWRGLSKRVLDFPPGMKVIAPSEFVARRLLGDGISQVSVLRNFVPDPGPVPSEVGAEKSLVYLGMLERHKGLRTLFRAFEKSSDRHEFTLDVVGTGSMASELERAAARSGLDDRIRMHGFLSRDEAEGFRSGAAAQIVPSEWFENCPLTILEAFSRGVPVIGSDSGGIPELVGPESGSSVFRCGDADALADAMTMTWETRASAPSRRVKARAAYDDRFRPQVHMDGYMKLINSSSGLDV